MTSPSNAGNFNGIISGELQDSGPTTGDKLQDSYLSVIGKVEAFQLGEDDGMEQYFISNRIKNEI